MRGTGPRATCFRCVFVVRECWFLRRSGSGDPELQCEALHAGDRPPRYGNMSVFRVACGGQAPARRGCESRETGKALLLKHQAFEEDIQDVCTRDNAVRVHIDFVRAFG